MKTYRFAYGSNSMELSLPKTAKIQELYGHKEPPIADIQAALYEALEQPIHQLLLRKWLVAEDKVTLIISDMSRFWMWQDLVIPHFINYLNKACGVQDENIILLVANGTHEGGSEAELRTLVTDEVFDRVRVVNHDCLAENLVYLGTTSHGTPVEVKPLAVGRKVIALGAATQHVMAGFGGGRKSILPGISSMETIRHNHALDPDAPRSNPAIGNAVLAGNPLHDDMCQAAGMIEHLYVVSLVMNADMKLARIFTGHWMDSWLEACKAAVLPSILIGSIRCWQEHWM